MRVNSQFPVNLVIFTEEILDGKIHFLCSAIILIVKLLLRKCNFKNTQNNKANFDAPCKVVLLFILFDSLYMIMSLLPTVSVWLLTAN